MKRQRTEIGQALHSMNKRLKRLYNKLPNEIRALDYRDKRDGRKPREFKDGWKKPARRDIYRMMDMQDGHCAICYELLPDETRFIHVDHCHDTLLVRGVLCNGCNLGLGQFKDNPDALENAAAYVRKYRAIHTRVKSDAQRALWIGFPDHFLAALPSD